MGKDKEIGNYDPRLEEAFSDLLVGSIVAFTVRNFRLVGTLYAPCIELTTGISTNVLKTEWSGFNRGTCWMDLVTHSVVTLPIDAQ